MAGLDVGRVAEGQAEGVGAGDVEEGEDAEGLRASAELTLVERGSRGAGIRTLPVSLLS